MNRNLLFIITVVFISLSLNAQISDIEPKEHFFSFSYKSLYKKISIQRDSSKLEWYLKAYLNKAIKETNPKETVNAYKNYLHYSKPKHRLQYADSMILSAVKYKDTLLIGKSYLTKGIVYYSDKNYKKALDHFIISKKLIYHLGATYTNHKIEYNIAQVKYYLGYYEEAQEIFTKCLNFFKIKDIQQAYVNSLHYLALCQNRLHNYGLSLETNSRGMELDKKINQNKLQSHFKLLKGINYYYVNNYKMSIELLRQVLPEFVKKNDFPNISVCQYYIGKNYWELNQNKKAIPHLAAVDSIFNNTGYINPNLSPAYKLVINYYETQGQPENRLYYVDQLLKVDSILKTTYTYLSKKINDSKTYTTKQLIVEKQTIEEQLKQEKRQQNLGRWIISITLFAILVLILNHYRMQVKYRKRFKALMDLNTPEEKNKKKAPKVKTPPGIKQKTVREILEKLETFEKTHKFLEKDISVSGLAESIKTNHRYVSEIISYHKGKNFVAYINELRINYIINRLKEDKLLREYKISYLADLAGFNNDRHFSNAFHKVSHIWPSYFISQLKNQSE
ncbi:helix-turn-helix domain-containing protein [Zhouia spongiae]|uniref:Helix-turn-helix domain-containing protein n=1 Tax=Zhouia spongiae TaxID=2202721 RepID=A0ABY3YJX4_9FLAO|nr:helix-turn-helix domain-containing protein [Zhouia spongiae]UNY97899.1 helix-turn-helix domain-containing protein [Zhouia spongiae]